MTASALHPAYDVAAGPSTWCPASTNGNWESSGDVADPWDREAWQA